MLSPELKDESQCEDTVPTLSYCWRRGWVRGSPSTELHTTHKHMTSTPLPPLILRSPESRSPPVGLMGFSFVLSSTKDQALSGACGETVTQHFHTCLGPSVRVI
ncbi:unnamed protein product [Pipistrellus nathusii]|uniref:Uncharacterized protein n=1 Tax=Pipistrellus nathusii TaxID=59473 RepID=A0ABP0ABY6_PIPNA